MSWLGDSLTNLKGQISNFTKEVLAENSEENEEFVEADELKKCKDKIAELEAICTHQKQEIDHLQILSTGFKEKSDALDVQNKSLVDSYQKLLQTKDEENQQLHTIVQQLLEREALMASNTVLEKEEQVGRLSKQLEEINNNNVAKIDRYLVKNLIVGYFTTPADKRTEVLRVIATVLDFNREDRQKTGLETTSMWPFGRGNAGGDTGDIARQQSFTGAFVRFLEAESQPKTQIKIPLDEMTRRNSKSSGSSTPVFGASGDGPTRHSSTSSSAGVSEMSVNLPVLNQADRSNSILKDVLNPRSS